MNNISLYVYITCNLFIHLAGYMHRCTLLAIEHAASFGSVGSIPESEMTAS